MRKFIGLAVLAFVALPALEIFAVEYVPEVDPLTKPTEGEEEPPQGWAFSAKGGTTFTFTHNQKMVGQTDGTTLQFSLLGELKADWRRDQHEWLNSLALAYGLTKTPTLEQYQKSADQFEIKSIYYYHFASIDWLGVFARLRMTTSLFPGYHIQATDVEIVLLDRDGGVKRDGLLEAEERYQLVGSFEPIVLRESAGGFANPFDGETFSLKTKLGAGVQQILARDGYVLEDDGATPELELKQMESSNEVGAEAEIEAAGAINENVTWLLGANLFYPLVSSVDTDLSDEDKLNAEISGKLSVKLADWANLEYLLTAKRVPLVLNEWQVQNGLVLSLSVSTP